MNNTQLLKMLASNRDLIQRSIPGALDDLQHLIDDCAAIEDDTVLLYLELNQALVDIFFHSRYKAAIERCSTAIGRFKNAHRIAFAWHYWALGHCCALLGRHDECAGYLDKVTAHVTRADSEYPWIMVGALIARVMNNEVQDELDDTSLDYALEALKIVEELNDPVRKASCHTAMGNVLHNRGRYQEALDYFLLSLQVYEQHYKLSDMAGAYSNIGTSYIGLGDFKKAEDYLLKSVELRNQFSSPDQLSISYHNLAIVYKNLNDLPRTKEMLEKCCDILERNGSTAFLNATRRMLADVEREMAGSD